MIEISTYKHVFSKTKIKLIYTAIKTYTHVSA